MEETQHLPHNIAEGLNQGPFVEFAEKLLAWCGLDNASPLLAAAAMIVISVLIAWGIYWVSEQVLFLVVGRIVKKTHSDADDYLLNNKVLATVAYLPCIVTLYAFGNAMSGGHWLVAFYVKCVSLYTVFGVGRFLLALLGGSFDLLKVKYPRARSLQSVKQLFSYVIAILMIIVMFAIIIDRSPQVLLAGLGASAALMSLVFKETIVSLVSGIQLAANNMLAPGDWVTVPKAGADGVVTEVSLNTVKIRNWDNTITMVPPTTLMQDSFTNWKGMSEAAGRRFCRTVIVDLATVHFLTAAEEKRFASLPQLAAFFAHRKADMEAGGYAEPLTNLTLYRHFIFNYLARNPRLQSPDKENINMMMRYKEPTQYGMPIEAYCFTKTKVWEEYEGTLADVVDHMLASLVIFDLRAYQRGHSPKDASDARDAERIERACTFGLNDQQMLDYNDNKYSF